MTYKQFQNIVEGMEPPPKPVPTLTLQMLGSAVTPIAGKWPAQLLWCDDTVSARTESSQHGKLFVIEIGTCPTCG
jgi:hypothetical protein